MIAPEGPRSDEDTTRTMDDAKISKIKAAVKNNFNLSPSHYMAFEDTYGFFRMLNAALLGRMRVPAGARILDIGCGTGASSLQILEAIPECRVWGLDISAAMLAAARVRVGSSDRITFVEADAAQLSEHFDRPFGAIIYSASIFLIPDYRESLRQAHRLLKEGGHLGLTFMEGLFDAEGSNLFALADMEAREGVSLRKPVDSGEFQTFFNEVFPQNSVWFEDFRLPEDLLRSFFSVPAMSAGLFPGIAYEERVRKIGRLFDHMPKTEAVFRWVGMIGEGGD